MPKARKTKKFAAVKRMLNPNDQRLLQQPRQQQRAVLVTSSAASTAGDAARRTGKQELQARSAGSLDKQKRAEPTAVEVAPSSLFFTYNSELGPPYHVLVDTNFINFSIQNKLDVCESMMNCLYAKATPYITECVYAELEKLGSKFRVALRIAKDPRFVRLPCTHKGTYADDCLVSRVEMHKCWIVATCDRDLKRRIRKIPGVPIMYISSRKYTIERMPEAFGAPRT